MLTVAKVTATGAAGYAEYLEGRAKPTVLGDYYLKDGERIEAPGRWAAGAAELGCDGERPVGGEVLRELMAVRDPRTGHALRPSGGNGEAVAALDATFSAPKSVSAAWALADAGLRVRIEAAHEQAIDRALNYATRTVPMVRERVDRQTVERRTPAGLIATSWRHTTARAVADRPPDPQLHSHVLLHGALRRDGRVVAIDSRAWLVHRRELGAAYRTELAHELNRLGFAIQRGTGRGGRYFEIEGVPAALVDRWSSRHHQVKEAIDARVEEKRVALEQLISAGGPDAREAAVRLDRLQAGAGLSAAEDRLMTASTRSPKTALSTRADLDRHWAQTARPRGLDDSGVKRLRSDRRPLAAADDRELLSRLTEFDATFSGTEARAVALEASAGVSIRGALWRLTELRHGDELIGLRDGRETTWAHRNSEHETVAAAERLAAGRVTDIPTRLIERETARLDGQLRRLGVGLAGEQREALALACSDRQLVVIEGRAGSGKSTVLTGVARAHQADGRQIITTSTAALAAQRLASELQVAGVDAHAYSTASLNAALASGHLQLGAGMTVIHDEAALASTREQHQLLAAVEGSGARLIEVGDPRQSHAVGASGLWAHLEHTALANGAHRELTRNQRALDPEDRTDQDLFRNDQIDLALARYQDRGRVSSAEEPRIVEDRALEAAHADRQAGKRTLVIAQTSNEQLDALNARAQAIRRQDGQLGQESIPVGGRPYDLHASDEIQVRRNLTHPKHGRIANGTTGTITAIDPDRSGATVELSDGRRVALAQEALDRAEVRLAYVQHPFPAQGQTTDTAHLIIGPQATREGSYVGLTRAREQTHIYTDTPPDAVEPADRLGVLAERMNQTEPDLPSIHTPLAHEHTIIDSADATLHRSSEPEECRDPSPNRPARSDPPGYVTAALGPPPATTGPDQARWEHAAAAIAHYRDRYNIAADDPRALGPEPRAGQFQQRHDRNQVAQTLNHARTHLSPPHHEPTAAQERDIDDNDTAARLTTASRVDELEP